MGAFERWDMLRIAAVDVCDALEEATGLAAALRSATEAAHHANAERISTPEMEAADLVMLDMLSYHLDELSHHFAFNLQQFRDRADGLRLLNGERSSIQ